MNIDHLTDAEVLRYLENLSLSPFEKRVARMLGKHATLLQDLQAAGMNEDLLFDNCYEPREYIWHLLNEVEYYQNELSDAQNKIADLEARTLIDFMRQIQDKQEDTERELSRTRHELYKSNDELEKTKSKLKMWTTLNATPKELA